MTAISKGKTALVNALLLLVSIMVSLLVGELLVTAFSTGNRVGVITEQTDFGLMVNRSEGTARDMFDDREVTYRFAEPHLRGPVSQGRHDVLVLGDSFTFGLLLQDEDTYVSQLQRAVDRDFGKGEFVFRNAAVNGSGTADYTAFVDHFGETSKPDIVLVFLNIHDIERMLNRSFWSFSPETNLVCRTPGSRMGTKDFVNNIPGYQWLAENSNLVFLLRRRATLLYKQLRAKTLQRDLDVAPGSTVERREYAVSFASALFAHLSNWCRENGVTLLVTTTGWHQPPYDRTSEDVTEAFLAVSDSVFRRLGVPFSDPSPTMRQEMQPDPLRYEIKDGDHPNEMGAELIATHTYPFIRSELVRYCLSGGQCLDTHASYDK